MNTNVIEIQKRCVSLQCYTQKEFTKYQVVCSVLCLQIYFGTSCILFLNILHDERHFLSGKVEKPVGESFLEKGNASSSKF